MLGKWKRLWIIYRLEACSLRHWVAVMVERADGRVRCPRSNPGSSHPSCVIEVSYQTQVLIYQLFIQFPNFYIGAKDSTHFLQLL